VRLFGYPASTALLVSVSLAQIGEFSFILAGLGVELGLLPVQGRNFILAGAILSILLNPLLFAWLDLLAARREKAKAQAKAEAAAAAAKPEDEEAMREPIRPTALSDHVVLIGHGRVGSVISGALAKRDIPVLVIEDRDELVAGLAGAGTETRIGNAADPEMIAAANLAAARCLLVAIPDAFESGQVVEQARAINPDLTIVARSHSAAETEHLKRHGASIVVLGEHEIAMAMLALVPAAGPAAGAEPKDAPAGSQS
jgi:CPA2 family monovalent cation:H+ antiporter-2